MTFSSLSRAVAIASVAAALSACGSPAPAPSKCPNDSPETCPATAATFAAGVQPGVQSILQARCGACHVAGGVESVRPFQTYVDVKKQTMDIFLSISACIMPPADQAQPTEDERQAIMSWIVCGAMDD